MIKIFIGTYDSPAEWKWYDLYDPTELEAAKLNWEELCKGFSEPLISDIESDFHLIQENNIEYYLEMEEFLENLDEYDLPKVCGLLLHDRSYYNQVSLLEGAMDDTNIYHGTFKDVAIEIADERLSCYSSGKDSEALIKFAGMYFDYEKFERDLHYEMNYEEFEYNGKDYVLELY